MTFIKILMKLKYYMQCRCEVNNTVFLFIIISKTKQTTFAVIKEHV